MLIQFNFKNYKSFKEEVSLDLSATKITEHKDHITKIGNDKLLKVAAIYGANASGKTNIYEAYAFMYYYVISSFDFGGDSNNSLKDNSRKIRVTPFLFDETCSKDESTFEAFFIDNKDPSQKTYQYGFAIKNNEVCEEWLFSKAKTAKEYKTIFYRKKGQKSEFLGIAKSSTENINVALEKETLIVSLGSKLKINKLKMIRDWFLHNKIENFADPTNNLRRSTTIPMDFINDKNIQRKVVDYFSSFDGGIDDFVVNEVKDENEKDSRKRYNIYTLHKMVGLNQKFAIPLLFESSGTQKMFELFFPLKGVLEQGGLLFVDELNAKLHPLLVRNIILTFLNPETNPNNAQLIFTTHDIWQLSNDILRRDEIWFVEKDKDGVSSLYSLADFVDESGVKIRKDESYAKNYLTGKYGAIPSLKTLYTFKEE